MALTMPLLFLFHKTHAQGTTGIIKPDTTVSPVIKQPEIMGKLIYQPQQRTTITGKVVDEKNNPVPFATVKEKGTKNAVAANADGNFFLKVNGNSDVILIVSAIGVNTKEEKVDLSNFKDNISIFVHTSNAILGGDVVVIAGYAIKHKPITRVDIIKTGIEKILNVNAFKTYPNPVDANGFINIQIKDAGNYQILLLDNESRLVQAEEIDIDADKSISQIHLSSNIAAGIYYLRLINERTGKQYTEKLIIQ